MKLALAMTLVLSGCAAKQISAYNNDDLCKALGTYNSNGHTVLRITEEINKRGSGIDQERFYALSRIEIKRGGNILSTDNNFPDNKFGAHDLEQQQRLSRDIQRHLESQH
ncbi:hypothetical protein CS369_20900 [Candidatus Symbiopectobacterium sp. 'North America']|uniref:hypothetical protein n=1 Tax=Candidatus Symbiopectobacterium sp. 'North America' TaxID=2794574 RepID=UPI0018CAC045|nr:hypothetical protein [Candidatus Symbiopectobacterium sp. 'North America']MBG6246569.1 hypothetical protein [Candidatus Symbiopectobacterium sp. 'North America']